MSGPFPSGHKVLSTDLNPILLGWIDFLAWFGTTLAYVSADAPTFVFSVNADVTAIIEPGMRVKLTQTTDKFFIVTAVGAFSAGVTPITVYGGTDYTLANTAITAGSFSTHKKPFGFNASPAKWTETLRDTVDRAIATPTSGVWGNPGALSISLPVGAWDVLLETSAEAIASAASSLSVETTLSTANNSESDADMSGYAVVGISSGNLIATFARRKTISVTVKTPYFVNIRTQSGSQTSIDIKGSVAPTIVRATCAYL